MNEELIKHQLDIHDKRINNHADRLDKLEQKQTEFTIEIKNLCDNIKNLTSVLKWLCTLIGGSFVGFFFYAVQNHIFK